MAKKKEIEIIVSNKPNNDISPKERRLMELINGSDPINNEEKKLVQEIKEIKNKGYVVWIPSD